MTSYRGEYQAGPKLQRVPIFGGRRPIGQLPYPPRHGASIRAAFACALARRDCTLEQVIATAEYLYGKGGATPAEAVCIARITATGEHSMNAVFVQPGAEAPELLACAGSVSRLGTLNDGLLAYARSHPNG